MILYTSDSHRKNRQSFKTALTYFFITLFCGFFSLVYEHFSHGVYSGYMVYLFLFPLIGGVIPFSLLWFTGGRYYPGRFTVNMYNSGVAVLTVGSCLQGTLEIYGTTSLYMSVYWYAGSILLGLGFLGFLCSQLLSRQKHSH